MGSREGVGCCTRAVCGGERLALVHRGASCKLLPGCREQGQGSKGHAEAQARRTHAELGAGYCCNRGELGTKRRRPLADGRASDDEVQAKCCAGAGHIIACLPLPASATPAPMQAAACLHSPTKAVFAKARRSACLCQAASMTPPGGVPPRPATCLLPAGTLYMCNCYKSCRGAATRAQVQRKAWLLHRKEHNSRRPTSSCRHACRRPSWADPCRGAAAGQP